MNDRTVPEEPCLRAQERLPDYWQNKLVAGERVWLDQHLQNCRDCAELCALWRDLGQLPEIAPDPQQKRRFDAMLAANRTVPSQWATASDWRKWFRPLPLGFAFGLLLVGLAGGWWLSGLDGSAHESEIAALRTEVRDTKALVVLSMLQQQSANDRLAGVAYSNSLGPLDPQITQALLHSLQYDPSPDVRLAALDALQRANSGDKVPSAAMRGLVDAFKQQDSPLVQIAFLDSFIELRLPEARPLLQKVSSDPAYGLEVRERAAWGLSHWN